MPFHVADLHVQYESNIYGHWAGYCIHFVLYKLLVVPALALLTTSFSSKMYFQPESGIGADLNLGLTIDPEALIISKY